MGKGYGTGSSSRLTASRKALATVTDDVFADVRGLPDSALTKLNLVIKPHRGSQPEGI